MNLDLHYKSYFNLYNVFAVSCFCPLSIIFDTGLLFVSASCGPATDLMCLVCDHSLRP